MNKGKVYLVGAGPGDGGLLTIKGRDILNRADVVVYDNLVGDEILSVIPKRAKTINVGKRGGHHTMPQEEINKVLLEEAQKGQTVVRLKGGDPFLFGRGGEELELLSKEGIPYEVVPGVTSAVAVPAYNGIPVTHRDYCSSVHIITGHKRAGKEYDINFKALVDTKGTLVFLMGVTALEDIMKGLMEAGMDPETPAAILEKGTTARQRRVVSCVKDLKEEADRRKVGTPAVIVVGEVCLLADKFAWREKLPLAGKKIVVTRPADFVSEMARKLRLKGAEVLEIPAISTSAIENNEKFDACLENLSRYDWIAFTSPAGVRIFFEEMEKKNKDVRSLSGIKIAALGSGSAKALRKYGIVADLVPEIYDGESLGRALARDMEENSRILIPRAAMGNREIIQELKFRKDIEIDDIATYDTFYVKQDIVDERARFEAGDIDCAVFTSASTVKGFVRACEGLDYSKVTAACIGKQTKAEADKYGMKTFMAKKATMDSVSELVEEILTGTSQQKA